MSERGFFVIDRGVWDHPLFAQEQFSEREAWFWLISSAAWEPTTVRVGRLSVSINRGECAFSLRFLATKWRWSEARVRRFLDRLTRDAAIATEATHQATHITICNYNDYQLSRRTNVEQTDALVSEKSTQRRIKKEIKEEEKKEESREDARSFGYPADYQEQFWAKYPHKVGKPDALKKLAAARPKVPWSTLLAGLEAYINDKPPDRPWCNPATWLNQERWNDQPLNVVPYGKPRSEIIQAADDLRREIAEFDGPARGSAELRGGARPPPLRLLSNG